MKALAKKIVSILFITVNIGQSAWCKQLNSVTNATPQQPVATKIHSTQTRESFSTRNVINSTKLNKQELQRDYYVLWQENNELLRGVDCLRNASNRFKYKLMHVIRKSIVAGFAIVMLCANQFGVIITIEIHERVR